MTQNDPSKIDQLLDLLLDALQERQAKRVDVEPTPVATQAMQPVPEPAAFAEPVMEATSVDIAAVESLPAEIEEIVPTMPEKLPSIQLDRMLGRLAVFIVALVVIVNVPFNRFGTNLARAMPDEQALVIRDGLVLQGEGNEIYVLENNEKRWISSIEAFNYYGYRWQQVNQVDDEFLARFPDGAPLSILYKCASEPHVYAIENGQRRWIKDIATFQAQGYIWEDVQTVTCGRIDNLPAGPPIPPDAGEPPDS